MAIQRYIQNRRPGQDQLIGGTKKSLKAIYKKFHAMVPWDELNFFLYRPGGMNLAN